MLVADTFPNVVFVVDFYIQNSHMIGDLLIVVHSVDFQCFDVGHLKFNHHKA